MEYETDLPEAPPMPEPDSLHMGLICLTIANLILLTFVFCNGFAPIISGGVVSAASGPIAKLEALAQPDEFKGPLRKQVEADENRDEFLKKWKWHLAVAILSVPTAVGLLRCSYFSAQRDFAYGELRIWISMAAIVLLANLILGWGSTWTFGFAILAIGELVLLHVPTVKFYLAEATPEQIASARGQLDDDDAQ